jgi:hypothetical protein
MSKEITARAVAAFRIAEELAEVYDNCSIELCEYAALHRRHCPECLKYLGACEELAVLIGLKPWQPSPVDVPDEPPDDLGKVADWQWAHDQRVRLLAAVAETEKLARRQTRSRRSGRR